jgi:hypothetical protein
MSMSIRNYLLQVPDKTTNRRSGSLEVHPRAAAAALADNNHMPAAKRKNGRRKNIPDVEGPWQTIADALERLGEREAALLVVANPVGDGSAVRSRRMLRSRRRVLRRSA